MNVPVMLSVIVFSVLMFFWCMGNQHTSEEQRRYRTSTAWLVGAVLFGSCAVCLSGIVFVVVFV